MPCFLARVSEHSGLDNACEFVGIIYADDAAELADIVDEFLEPTRCQYALLPGGMIFAKGKVPLVPRVVVADEEDGIEDADYFKGVNLSEDWRAHLSGRTFDDETIAWLTFEDLFLIGETPN